MKIRLMINSHSRVLEINPAETLLDVLRNNNHHEVKRGCDEGHCGSCVVLLNNRAVNACQVLAASANGSSVTTVKGIGTQKQPHLIQQCLAEVGGVQCGFCTPGIVISAYALLQKNRNPSENDIRIALDGNLCRCTGYVKIVEGIMLAAKRMNP